MTRAVAVVPHSHWDREWHAPLETYRVRLVAMLDGLLDLLTREPAFEHFHLDGQFAVVDDYLEARPEAAVSVARLIAEGRLAVGPWYVLMDEFCVSAETIIRNLQLGLARTEAVGGRSREPVGYLPDMFGHVTQMPQILAQAGVRHAVVWRGVPSVIRAQAFWWEAPDGSRVRAEYLPVGYAAGAFLPGEHGALLRRMEAYEREIGPFIGSEGTILLMNGGDHQTPQAHVPSLLASANRAQSHFRFELMPLARYLEGQTVDGLAPWRGELRSGARAPLLMGVLSNRVDVKQAAAAAEEALEKRAEPLATLWLPPELWPGGLLERAWRHVIHNSAHDSVCACSADTVGRAVRHRYDSAVAIAEEVASAALAIAQVATASPGHLVLNPLPSDRAGLVEFDLPGTEPPPGTQQVSQTEGAVVACSGYGRDLGTLLGRLAEAGCLGPSGRGVAAELSGGRSGEGPALTLTLHHDPTRGVDPALAPVLAEAWARAGAGRDEPLTVRVVQAPAQRVVARVEAPGWGWAVWPGSSASPASPASPVEVHPGEHSVRLSNGRADVEVDARSGTFTLDGVPGQNGILEEGDDGDTYNFSPSGRPAVGGPSTVSVEVLEAGPVRGRVRVRRWFPWAAETEVVSDVELHAGESLVRITTSFDHTGKDHRIRAVFPLGTAATSTEAECAFATVVRAEAEGGPQEPALATFPSRRFVTAGPTTVTHQGLLEYELIDGGSALALTLLRATGILSRPAPPARPTTAGPPLPLRDAQMPGPQLFRYGVARHTPDPWDLADATWTPLVVVPAAGGGRLPDRGTRLTVSGARVSALYRREGRIEVRVFNPSADPAMVRIPGLSGVLLDLRGRPLSDWQETFALAPWAFATARLDASGLD
jgi:mannosylglycerate hydrolase